MRERASEEDTAQREKDDALKATRKAVGQFNERQPEADRGIIILSTGVKLNVTNVSTAAYGAIKTQMFRERPKAPTQYVAKLEMEETNPNDPDYLAALDDFEERSTQRMIDAAFMLGTEVRSLPDKFPPPESTDWERKLRVLGVDIPSVDKVDEHYLAWVKLCAAPTAEDIADILLATSRKAGVTEEDAAEAAASFRDTA